MAFPDFLPLRFDGAAGCVFPGLRGRGALSSGARERVLPGRHQRLQGKCFESAAAGEERERGGDGEAEEDGGEWD